MALNAGKILIPENADSIIAVKDGNEIQIDLVNAVSNGVTITVWKKQKYYYIAFNKNGGSGNMSQQTISVGVDTKLTKNAFALVGYLFSGWAKSASGSKAYSDQQEVTDIAAAGATLTLYALWSAITYYVKYNGNGNTGGSMSDSAHQYDVAKSLTSNAFAKTGYLFAGWANSASGSKAYNDGQSVKNLTSNDGATVNLYALWTAITYYVRYNGNGATNGSMENSTHLYNVAKALTANAFTRTGYLFTSWQATIDGATVVFADKESVEGLSSVHGATVNLYALWTAITYYVSYNGNGATSGSMSASTHRYDTAKKLTANTYARAGYSFQGWATSAAGSKAYDNGQSVNNLSATHGATVALYAVWKDLGYYAIKDGVLQSTAPNAAAWSSGYSNSSGNLTDNGNGGYAYYGGCGHTSGDGQSWGADTYSLDTNGCKYLDVTAYINNWTDGGGATLKIWGDSTELKDEYIYGSANLLYPYTFDVSAYSKVRVRIERTVGANANWWMNVGLREVRIRN